MELKLKEKDNIGMIRKVVKYKRVGSNMIMEVVTGRILYIGRKNVK